MSAPTKIVSALKNYWADRRQTQRARDARLEKPCAARETILLKEQSRLVEEDETLLTRVFGLSNPYGGNTSDFIVDFPHGNVLELETKAIKNLEAQDSHSSWHKNKDEIIKTWEHYYKTKQKRIDDTLAVMKENNAGWMAKPLLVLDNFMTDLACFENPLRAEGRAQARKKTTKPVYF